jgi:hypothetical protein
VSAGTVALVVLVSVGILAAALTLSATSGDLPDQGLRFDPAWAAVAVAGFVLTELYHATLWRLVLRRLGGNLGLLNSWSVWSLSSLGRWVPSSIPMALIRILGAQRAGVPRSLTAASIVYEGVFSLLAALLILSPLLTEAPSGVSVAAGLGLAIALAVAVEPRVFRRLADFALHRIGRNGLPTVLSRRLLLGFVLAFASSFLLAGLAVFATAAAFFDVSASLLPAAVGSFAAGFLASLLVFVLPAGIGAKEAGMTAALSTQMPLEAAITVSIVVRFVQIAIEFGVAAVTTALDRFRGRRDPGSVAEQVSAEGA